MVLRLHPREDNGQRVASFSLEIDPVAAPIAFEDPFGNACHLFNIHRSHERTAVRSKADVVTAPAPDLPDRLAADAWDALAEAAAPLDYFEFLAPSRFARPSPALAAFTDTNGLRRGGDPLSSLLEMARALHALFQYEPGSTAVDSPIEHILETGRGVCQDYTHVMLTIARSWGIPSRYVSGYLHREGAPGEQTPEGASHAWAEFLLPDLGWIGIDPDQRHPRRPPPCPHRRGPRLCRCSADAGCRVRRRGLPARSAGNCDRGGRARAGGRAPGGAAVPQRNGTHPGGPARRRRSVTAARRPG